MKPDLDLLRKLASGEGGERTGELRRRGWLEWRVTEAGMRALAETEMSADRITIELTRNEAERLAELSAYLRSGHIAQFSDAENKARAALAQHDRKGKREALGLPWMVSTYGGDWVVMNANSIVKLPRNKAQAHLMAAAPELAEALEALLGDEPRVDDPRHPVWWRARAALRKAGWTP